MAEKIRRRRKHDRAAIEGQSDANQSPVLSAFHGVAYYEDHVVGVLFPSTGRS